MTAVLTRLARKPERVTLEHPETGKPGVATIGRTQFAEALRVMTYTPEGASRVPLLIHRAYEGDVTAFARTGLASNYGLRSILRHGMLMSTTCTDSIARGFLERASVTGLDTSCVSAVKVRPFLTQEPKPAPRT